MDFAWSGNIGGRTRALVVVPGSPVTTMYAGAASGGIGKPKAGMSWSPLNDLLPNLAVNALALDPGDTNVLYAGTGEGFFTEGRHSGRRVFQTESAGADWDPIGGTDQSVDFHYVNDVVVSPASSQRVYAATRTGVFRSLNAGGLWAQVLVSNAANGNYGCTISQFAPTARPTCSSQPAELAKRPQPPTQGHVWRNLDAGGSGAWIDVYTEAGMGRTSLAIAAPPNQNIVYALSATVESGAFENGLHAVFRSTTGAIQVAGRRAFAIRHRLP